MAKLWFSSDHHFRHANIIQYAGRPFSSVWQMDEVLVTLHNELVKPEDHWYCLGDISMWRPRMVASLIHKMNGHKRLVRGNHDIFKTREYLEVGFEEIYGVRVIDHILFTHIPVHPDSLGKFVANVHGHTHEKADYPPCRSRKDKHDEVLVQPYVNICVERTAYKPISLEEVKARIEAAKKV